jgi:hypothetical protein
MGLSPRRSLVWIDDIRGNPGGWAGWLGKNFSSGRPKRKTGDHQCFAGFGAVEVVGSG